MSLFGMDWLGVHFGCSINLACMRRFCDDFIYDRPAMGGPHDTRKAMRVCARRILLDQEKQ
jgi:hypothetical protein